MRRFLKEFQGKLPKHPPGLLKAQRSGPILLERALRDRHGRFAYCAPWYRSNKTVGTFKHNKLHPTLLLFLFVKNSRSKNPQVEKFGGLPLSGCPVEFIFAPRQILTLTTVTGRLTACRNSPRSHMVNLRTKNPQSNLLAWITGKFPTDLGIPPLTIEHQLESKPLNPDS